MQNQFVFSAGKSFVGHLFSGGIVKGLGFPQQKNALLPRFKSDVQTRNLSDERGNISFLLPGGGLGKLRGSFKEEQYFNIHEHMLVAQLQRTGYKLKCESTLNSNWKEFERMANNLTQLTAVRQSGQLCKHKNCTEESFFLQEQRNLLERIIDAVRGLFGDSGNELFGPQYFKTGDQKENEENNENKTEDDNDEDADKSASKDDTDTDTDRVSEENDDLSQLDENKSPNIPKSDSNSRDGASGSDGSGRD